MRHDGQYTDRAGQPQRNIVNTVIALTGADQTISLGVDCSTVIMRPEGADLHVNLKNDAAAVAANHPKIPADTGFEYHGPPINTFRVISSAAGTLNLWAW